MRRGVTITGSICGIAGALAAALFLLSAHCGAWAPLGCRGTDPELTRMVQ